MVSAFDSSISSSAFADAELADLFSDEAELQALIKVERELARVQESLGIIPQGAGKEISCALKSSTLDPASLAAGFKKDGIPIPALLKQLREILPESAANYLHWGATSQDIMDTALVLRLKTATYLFSLKLSRLCTQLAALAQQHRATVMVARTRNQSAAPTVFGLKIVNWLMPLQRQQTRLQELLPRLLLVQFGGAVGTNAALGTKGLQVIQSLAEALELLPSSAPWHAQRDGIVEFAMWCSLTAGVIGKMGQDLLLMSQNEVAEIGFSGAGKSSTMPNKSNPVLPETLLALAHFCRSQADLMQQTLLVTHERDGAGMAIERMALAPLVCASGTSVSLASHCLDTMQINTIAMGKNLTAGNGLTMAEAAVFALSQVTDRLAASELVAKACGIAAQNDTQLIDELRKLVELPLDWESLKQAENYLGVADEIIDYVLKSEAP